jgi:hypothetical protein
MDATQKKIWYQWRLMHFRAQTLAAQLELTAYHSNMGYAIQQELTELNGQMAEIEDEHDWLAPVIADSFHD